MNTLSRPSLVNVNFQAWTRVVAEKKVPALLIAILVADALFIVLHLAFVFGIGLSDRNFWLAQDRGYAEQFQYLKLLGMSAFLAALVRKKPAPVFLHWIGLFAYFLLDDALRIHEQVGKWLADWLVLPDLLNAQGFHIGELLFFALIGNFFLITLSITYTRSDEESRTFSLNLILLAVCLAIFGVGLDLVQELVASSWLYMLIGTLEDGGELVIVSMMVWTVYLQANKLLGWEGRSKTGLQTAAYGVALFLLFVILLSFVQYGTPGLAGNDGYYHAKMGLLVRQEGLQPVPPQLPLTILNEADYHNHHLLYHIYLAIFASTDPSLDGGVGLTKNIKLASVLMPAIAFMAIWWLLRRQGVGYPAVWSLGLMVISAAFLYRMSMPRVQAASLLVLVLGFHLLASAQYRWLLPLGFAYVWLFNGFSLLLLMVGAYFAATWIAERRRVWVVFLYPTIGVLLGLIINPYFPQNLVFLGRHLAPKLGQITTAVGSEWYPYSIADLMPNLGLTVALLLIGFAALGWRRESADNLTITALIMTIIFGVMLFKSRRFVEYFPPFVLIFAALSTRPWLERISVKWNHRSPWLPQGLALLLIIPVILTIRSARISMARSQPPDQYASAALWLKAYSEQGSRVFQTDWDDFPRLFFYDSDKEYTVGLDPTFMELHDSARFAEWVRITRGEVAMPSLAIQNQFEADFVFSDLEHDQFLNQAANDRGLNEIYRDDYAVIFEVLPNLPE